MEFTFDLSKLTPFPEIQPLPVIKRDEVPKPLPAVKISSLAEKSTLLTHTDKEKFKPEIKEREEIQHPSPKLFLGDMDFLKELPPLGPIGEEKISSEMIKIPVSPIEEPYTQTVILEEGSQPTIIHKPENKEVGKDGLSINTDLKTLSKVQKSIQQDPLINPSALFQKQIKIPITIPKPIEIEKPVMEIELPEISESDLDEMPIQIPKFPEIKEIAPKEGIALPKVITMPSPMKQELLPEKKKRRPAKEKVKMPKIKSTAVKPSPAILVEQKYKDSAVIKISLSPTIISPIPLKSPSNGKPITKTVAIAHTPKQQVLENINKIDISKLNVKKSRKSNDSYSVVELRQIAGSLNLSKSGNKKTLVERIKAAILKVKPEAFD